MLSPQLATPNLQPARAATMPPVQLEGLGDLTSTVRQIQGLVAGMEVSNVITVNGVSDPEAAAQAVQRKQQMARRRLAGR